MYKLPILTTVAALFITSLSYGYTPKNEAPLDTTAATEQNHISNILHGGFTIGARVGGSSYLYFSPFIGIQKGRWYPAIGLSFSQYIQNYPYVKDERIGIRAMCRYQVMKAFFASFEYDGQKNAVAYQDGFTKQWTNNLFLGVGTKIRLSEVTHATFEFLYHVNYESGKSPYGFKQMLGRVGLTF